jgi:hypothetical protein
LRQTTSGAAGNGLGTAIKYLRHTTSGAAGNGLGTAINILRQTSSGAAGNGLGTTIKYLRRTTSGAAGSGLSRCRGILMGPFTTSALRSPFFVHGSATIKQNSNAEVRGLGGQCLSVESGLIAVFIWRIRLKVWYMHWTERVGAIEIGTE